jgi:hypothetical protein
VASTIKFLNQQRREVLQRAQILIGDLQPRFGVSYAECACASAGSVEQWYPGDELSGEGNRRGAPGICAVQHEAMPKTGRLLAKKAGALRVRFAEDKDVIGTV